MTKGDMIRENRIGATVEEVMTVRGNIIETYSGNTYHITKVVRA